MDDDARSTLASSARARAVAHFGVGNELLVCNLDGRGAREAPRRVTWSGFSASRAALATTTSEALFAMRDREASSMANGTYVEDAFATLHDFTRAVAAALEESSSSSSEGLASDEHAALSRAVWALLDVYFVTRGGGLGVSTDEFVGWYRDNAASLDLGTTSASSRLRDLLDALFTSTRHEEAEGYWGMIVTMTALGWTEAAIDLMATHSAWAEWRLRKTSVQPQVELMEAAQALLRTMPKLGADDGAAAASVPQYTSYRHEWLRQVKAVLAEGELFNNCWGPTADGVRDVLLVLSGDERTIASSVGNWVELAVAQLQHVHPTLKIHEHESLARSARRTKGPLAAEALDALVMRAIAGDSQGVISVCSMHLDPWFMAFSTVMLSRAGGAQADVLRRPTASGASQSELYMLEYCSALATSEDTRALAVKILAATCPQRGAEMMATALMRLAVVEDEQETEDDAPAKAAHALAVEVSLPNTSARIAKMASERARAHGYVSLAFDWLRQSQDAIASDALARGFVRVGENGGAAAALERVDKFMSKHGSIVLAPTDCEELGVHENTVDFYRERAKFNAAMKTLRASTASDPGARAAAKSAADALIAALAPRSTPSELWIELIVDAIPLFESAFAATELFDRDACRLLSARARFAADLSGADSASALHAASARPSDAVNANDLSVATASLAVARLTTRVALD
ncbi:Nucleoporin Nup85-like [Ostreococcus tauri]|uniref:Nuclear pore complex protein Nup85 n=1 Tax=Ostreococcus tauri TaxID=70448 RepID=A0A090LYC9_OSTTA|nr:Nucleoporin Nup85-like [Ostreococcus tauri]CEF96905.1 Nucleoporin Nup85-like [Ostreococcus tauri]|eukprot:XP_022838369.1 Nucleoporin Nup85-like [Ostreococcus tauri]